MQNDLTTLQFKRADNGDEYGFAVARAEGHWHIVRKQYGDNSATYNYAQFFTAASAYEAWDSDMSSIAWGGVPPSNVDFDVLLVGLTAPLPSSTDGGALATGAATSEQQLRNYEQLVKLNGAQPALNDDGTLKLKEPINVYVVNTTISTDGEMQTSSGATEPTLTAIKEQLAGTLTVHLDNPSEPPAIEFPQVQEVSGDFYPEVQAVSGPLTNEELRAQPVAVALDFPASQAVTGPATDAQLRASPLPVAVSFPASQPVTGPLTDGQLRAIPLAVTGPFFQATQPVSLATAPLAANAATATLQTAANSTLADINTKLAGALTVTFPSTQPVSGTVGIAGTVPVSGPLTDAQLRANAVPVSVAGVATANLQASGNTLLADLNNRLAGSLTVSFATSQPVTGPLTDSQLRAAPVPVSGFPTTYPVTGTFWQATQPVSAANLPLPNGASTAALQATGVTALQTLVANSPALVNGATPVTIQGSGLTATVTNGPVTPYSLVVATGNNATLVKTGATQLTGLVVTNATSSYRYLMLYNLATASVTGSTPLLTLGVPPNQSVTLPIPSSKYVAFSAGLSLAVGSAASLGTLVAGLLGGTGVSANDMVINATYS